MNVWWKCSNFSSGRTSTHWHGQNKNTPWPDALLHLLLKKVLKELKLSSNPKEHKRVLTVSFFSLSRLSDFPDFSKECEKEHYWFESCIKGFSFWKSYENLSKIHIKFEEEVKSMSSKSCFKETVEDFWCYAAILSQSGETSVFL